MLAIRLQRTGRKGHAQYRVVVQDARLTPTSGRIVYRLGNFDPHAKVLNIDKEKAEFYLSNGAQPSERVARLFKKEDIKLPDWVQISEPVKRDIRNPEKLRKNRPEEPQEETSAEPEATSEEAPAEEAAPEEAPKEEAAAEEPKAEESKDAEEKPAEDEKSAEKSDS